jgi:hypothetical protein
MGRDDVGIAPQTGPFMLPIFVATGISDIAGINMAPTESAMLMIPPVLYDY